MIYKKAMIIREGVIMNYELHDNICAICAHNPKRLCKYNNFLGGNCDMLNENVTECFNFLNYESN